MTKKHNTLLHTLAAALILLTTLATGCTDEESVLGLDLVDSSTLFNPKTDTLLPDLAWSSREDSLSFKSDFATLGNYTDATFGKVSSALFTQVALTTNSHDINLMEVTFDSVVLSLSKTQLFPDSTGTYRFHFEVMQLADSMPTKASGEYYSTKDELAVNPAAKFFDADVSVANQDSVVRLRLDTAVNTMLRQSGTASEFKQRAKGLRIRITNAAQEGMMTVSLTSSYTCLRAYYHHIVGSDTITGDYPFQLGDAVNARFTHFYHDYSGTVFANTDSIAGAGTLYLEPFGGHSIRMNFNTALLAFRTAHPTAVIHHAELLLPTSPASTTLLPERITISATNAEGKENYIMDELDNYTNTGFDGYYHSDRGAYRMRVTQHLQGLLRNGADYGWRLHLTSHLSAPERAQFNGTASANSPKIIFVYTE